MKALSGKQPWANLIASGEKSIETRLWATEYRGPLLIISSQTPRIAPAGYALALVDLIECRPMMLSDEKGAKCPVYDNAVAWLFRNVRALEPFPVGGQLGVFDVDIKPADLRFASLPHHEDAH
jgi:hypothetical protein